MKLAQVVFLTGSLIAGLAMRAEAQAGADTSRHEVYGTIDSITGSRLVIRTRTGARVYVDALPALTAHRTAVLFVGRVVGAEGTRDAAGVLHATTIERVPNPHPAGWPPDR
jgi:hypothetical protein